MLALRDVEHVKTAKLRFLFYFILYYFISLENKGKPEQASVATTWE